MNDQTLRRKRERRLALPWCLFAVLAPAGAGAPVFGTSPSAPPSAQGASRPFDVLHYRARVAPDVDAGTVRGTVVVSLLSSRDGLDRVTLRRGTLGIDAVRGEAGDELAFSATGPRLTIELGRPAAAGERRDIEIDYHGAPRFGLEMAADLRQVYTIFSTSQWMVCVDDPDDRATLELTLIVPEGWRVAANGVLGARRLLPGPDSEHPSHLDRAVPTYTFGFVAGVFNELVEQHGAISLRYLGRGETAAPGPTGESVEAGGIGASGFSEDDLRAIFADTGAMLDFFADRAGVPYPAESYTQALVAESIGQEMADLSLMSEDWGRRMLADPAASSLAAHEAAHQWWGNMVTCVDWTHFWLNEGFATFMAAEWMGHRFGAERYVAEIAASRARYERVRDAGGDKSLVFPDWDRPTSEDRTLVYDKGAYVLHLLREHLGEEDFWSGMRRYTGAYFGRSASTADFQTAMEQASGRDLSGFFAEWVYLTALRDPRI